MNIQSKILALIALAWLAETGHAEQPDTQPGEVPHRYFGELSYLDNSLLISHRHIQPLPGAERNWHGVPNLASPEPYELTEDKTQYLDLTPVRCQVDPFSPQPDADHARDRLTNCLQMQIWENEDIPPWVKIFGVALTLGAASEAGALDDQIRLSLGFDTMDKFLRNWMAESEN